MSCPDCAPLSIRHESMVRECDRLRDDLREAGAEAAGLRSEVARLKERCSALAGFAASVRERAAGG